MNRAEAHCVQAFKAADEALAHATEALRACTPKGSTVVWFWRGHRQYGTVVDHGFTRKRLLVRNATTGKIVWIGSWCLDFMQRGS